MTRIFLVILFLISANTASGSEIKAILVCDVKAEGIEKPVKSDLKNVSASLKKISEKTGIKLSLQTYTNKNLKESLQSHIKSLSVKEDDIIVFYFSGHGYRTEGKGDNRWPNLDWNQDQKAFDLKEIFLALKEKNPRLLIVLADCCNNVLPENVASPTEPFTITAYKSQKPLNIQKKNLKNLFLKARGTIIVSGAKPGDFSWCDVKGGFYTAAFFQAIGEVSKLPKPAKWESVLNKAGLKIEKKKYGQIPQFELNLEG